jgi:hypothetical protein
MADEQILWPLRAVSKDPTNLTKLDADNGVLTSTADVDARYVIKTGDTMTGQLIVQPAVGPAAPDGSVQVIGNGTNANITLQRNQDAGQPVLFFKKSRGTTAAPTVIQSGDTTATIQSRSYSAAGTYLTGAFINMACTKTPAAGDTGIASEIRFSVHDGAAATQAFVIAPTGVTSPNFTAGRIEVTGGTFLGGPIIQRATTGIAQIIEQTPPNATSQATGLSVDIMPEVSQFSIGIRVSNRGFGTNGNRGVEIVDLPVGADNYAILNNSLAASYFRGNVGIAALNATHKLEVGGDTMLRGPLGVTGNITSSGAAHSFANGSIPSPAVIGNTPRTIAATGSAGSAGQMVWDDNFLYLHTTSGWKKVPLSAI